MQLVDLAGADFDDRDLGSSTGSTTAQQRKESIDINKSLLALKECFRYDSIKNIKKSGSASVKIYIMDENRGLLQERRDKGVEDSKSLFPRKQAYQVRSYLFHVLKSFEIFKICIF